MQGEADLAVLLACMEPVLHDEEYGYGLAPPGAALPEAFAVIAEAEGVTVIAPVAVLVRQRIAHRGGWARISLTVHSDLAAAGLTAAVARALAGAGISANVVAGYFHDHVLVQCERRAEAMAILAGLAA